MDKIELLAPAGNLEKLKTAVIYGADAVYLGGETFGLRSYAENFTFAQMDEGVAFAHARGKKAYLTINIIPHNSDLDALPQYISNISDICFDGIILSDPGILTIVRKMLPGMEIHLSTQANNTNWASASFWHEQGIKRIILARELSLEEIREIRSKTPGTLDLEMFVHGSMCISYSGRCLLSSYMTGRDSNRGLCTHPCRWKYHLMEETRPGQYMPVFEDERGTYILNSKDLCLIGHIPEIIEAGVRSIKIEGRIKSSYYAATVVKAYRNVIDSYYSCKGKYKFEPYWREEIGKASNREFTTGFYSGKTEGSDQRYESGAYISEYDFVGIVKSYDRIKGLAEVEQRNKMQIGDIVEIFSPAGKHHTQTISKMYDSDMFPIDAAPHPQMTVYMALENEAAEYSMIRRERLDN
ncbi:MAG: U32 family peptidase, partial [Eubacteriales bacterium]|nr:U32 family peptidase [Eubacteriales bacterium]